MKNLKLVSAFLGLSGIALGAFAEIPDDASFSPQAVALYRVNAIKGDIDAMYLYGTARFQGWGIERDLLESAEILRAAARKGCNLAFYAVGGAHAAGRGVPKSKENAKKFYSRFIKWAIPAAEKGNSHAQCRLGHCYLDGKGVKVDFAEGAKWYLKSAKKGNLDGMYRIGLCLMESTGVKEDKKGAFEWFEKAARKGFAPAQFEVAKCYEKGLGVGKDSKKAMDWYTQSALQGFIPALDAIKRISDNPDNI